MCLINGSNFGETENLNSTLARIFWSIIHGLKFLISFIVLTFQKYFMYRAYKFKDLIIEVGQALVSSYTILGHEWSFTTKYIYAVKPIIMSQNLLFNYFLTRHTNVCVNQNEYVYRILNFGLHISFHILHF